MNPKQLARLTFLAGLKEKSTRKEFAAKQQKVADAEAQINDFNAFKAETAQGVRDATSYSGSQIAARANAFQFLGKLDKALEQTSAQRDFFEADAKQAQKVWLKHKAKEQAFDDLTQKAITEEEMLDAKRQDKQATEQYLTRLSGAHLRGGEVE